MASPPLAITVQPQKRANEQAYEDAKPKPQTLTAFLGGEDIATLVVNGRQNSSWLSVQVQTVLMESPAAAFALDIAEPNDMSVGGGMSWSKMMMKPGDRAALYLAGHKVVDGRVQKRGTNLDAGGHGVRIEGVSRDYDLTAATAKPRQFRGYGFEAIVKAMLKDAGMPSTFRMENAPAGIEQPFPNVITNRFASVYANIARLARMRGVYLYGDVDGNLVGTVAKANPAASEADIVEGHNLLSGNVMLDDETVLSGIRGIAQNQGSENVFGRSAAEIAAEGGSGEALPWLRRDFPIDGAVDQRTAQHRTKFAVADSYYTACDATVVVQGWRKRDGTLWKPSPEIRVLMPSFFPENGGAMLLALRAVTFTQGPGGTQTVLSMCLRRALGAPPDPGFRGGAPNLLAPGTSDAQPLTPEG